MSDAVLAEHAQLLEAVVEIHSVLVDPQVVPVANSPAEQELHAARAQPGATGVWGEDPIRLAYSLALLYYQAALEQAKAIAGMMTRGLTAVPAVVLARALVEVTGQAWWLLEPGIGHVQRVQRLQILRYRSAYEGQRAAKADGLLEDAYHEYTETTADVEEYSQQLALAVPVYSKGARTYLCGDERLPSATSLVRGLFAGVDVPSVYNLYSGYSHGHPYALWREFVREPSSDAMRYRAVVNEESFKGVVAIASYALYPPGERLARLFGVSPRSDEEH